jgi:hypothetical protein
MKTTKLLFASIGLAAILICGTVLGLIFLTRQLTTTITIHGVSADFIGIIYADYSAKTVITSPVQTGAQEYKAVFTIWSENAASEIWTNFTCTGLPPGATWSVTGEYWFVDSNALGVFKDPAIPSFDLAGYHVIQKDKCTYIEIIPHSAMPDSMMLVTWTWDQGTATEFGSFNLVLTLQAGFVGI